MTKNKIIRIANVIATFGTGMIISSMWITQTDNWKSYLPVVLLAIMVSLVMNEHKD